MKIHTILAAVLLAAAPAVPCHGQEIPCAPAEYRSTAPTVTTADGVTKVAFDAALPAGFVRSREICVVTPILVRDGVPTELPAMAVVGRYYKLVNECRIFCGEQRCDRGVYTPSVLYRGRGTEVHYQAEVPAVEAARTRVEFRAERRFICAYSAKETPEPDMVPVPELQPVAEAAPAADYSAFVNGTQIVYYTPGDLTRRGRYTHDFGGKSVFRFGSADVDGTVFDAGMQELAAQYRRLAGNPSVRIDAIRIETSASPEGDAAYNMRLSELRAGAVRRHMVSEFGVADTTLLRVKAVGENWDALLVALAASDVRDKESVGKIVRETSDFDLREQRLAALPDSSNIRQLYKNLRGCTMYIDYTETTPAGSKEPVESRLNAPAEFVSLAGARENSEADPTPQHLNNYLVALLQAGDYAAAAEVADRIPAQESCPVIALDKAVAYALNGETALAAEWFRKAGDTPAAAYDEGVMLLAAGDREAAARKFAQYENRK